MRSMYSDVASTCPADGGTTKVSKRETEPSARSNAR